jgi:hypothetical protein
MNLALLTDHREGALTTEETVWGFSNVNLVRFQAKASPCIHILYQTVRINLLEKPDQEVSFLYDGCFFLYNLW